jgi:hypothetical protein
MELTDPVVYGSALTVILTAVVFVWFGFKAFQAINKKSDD